MTIKNIGLSALAAIALSTSAYAADYSGELTVSGGINTISEELISAVDVNVSFKNALTYKNGMVASSATEPGFELKFTDAKLLSTSGATLVVKVADGEGYTDENKTIATFDRLDGGSVIFSTVTGSTVERTKKYMVVSKNDVNTTHTNNDTVLASDMNVTLQRGAGTAYAEMILYSNSGDSTLDDAKAQILEKKTQFTGSFGTKLDASIDASKDFLLFDTTSATAGASTTSTDDLSFTFANDQDITYHATVTKVDVNITSENDITAVSTITSSATAADTTTGSWTDGDFTGSRIGANTLYLYASTGNADNNGSITSENVVTIDGNTTVEETTFTAVSKVYFDGGLSKSLYGANSVDAGAWDIYGYNAQIPGASYSDGSTDTIVTVVNTQAKGTTAIDAYFTIIDADGNECKLDSTQGFDAVKQAVPGSKNKYKLSEMLTNCTTVSGTAYAIEVNVPTTPTDIYSNAFVQNIATANGRFKVLPVYNNANSY